MFLLKLKEVLLASDLFSFVIFLLFLTALIFVVGLYLEDFSKKNRE